MAAESSVLQANGMQSCSVPRAAAAALIGTETKSVSTDFAIHDTHPEWRCVDGIVQAVVAVFDGSNVKFKSVEEF